MVQINPNKVIERGIISNILNVEDQLQQVGIDLTLSGEDLIIQPLESRNIQINEKFDMQDTYGLIILRSSFSRKGIFMSSGVFDPGFKGTGGVSLYNMSGEKVEIKTGTRIGQILIFNADYASLYDGHYNKTQSIRSKYENE